MRRLIVLCVIVMISGLVFAQEAPVPTLVSPTVVPRNTEVNDALVTTSVVQSVQERGQVQIGILFNEPPFGELNIRGEVVGYDASLGRAFAETWGVEPIFVQVTRQGALEALERGDVDLLIAAQVHRRELDNDVTFSQSYYKGGQAMMVRLDDGVGSLGEMNGRRVGVVLGTASEGALQYWQQRTGVTVSAQSYLTLDAAIVALVNNEVDGIIDKRYRLRRRILTDSTRLLDEDVQPEPYAVVMRRQDVNMRNLVNRTLQYLASSGGLSDIQEEFFPFRTYDPGTVFVWENVGDEAPSLNQFGVEIRYPQQYVVPRLQSEGVLRVAGIVQPIPDNSEAERRLAESYVRLAEQIAARWGVSVSYVSGSENDPIGYVERGEADIAFGIRPDWNLSGQVDFSSAYLLRGKRMLVEQRDDYRSMNELRGQWVGVFESEPGTGELVRALGETVNAQLNVFTITRDEDAAFEMLVENNIDVIFGDSVRLLPHLEVNTDVLKFSDRCQTCDPWYTREYVALAVPHNDSDFLNLVDYTLQELWLDGTLDDVLRDVTVPGYRLGLDVWPGSDNFAGFSLSETS